MTRLDPLWNHTANATVALITLRDRVLERIESAVRWWTNPRCGWCGQPAADLEAHYAVEHAGDDDLFTAEQGRC